MKEASINRKVVREHTGLFSWISPDIMTYAYTAVAKYKWMREIVQSVVKLFIPAEIRTRGIILCLNKKDAIVSGALALGFYENHLLDQFIKMLQPGMVVVDLGANIGLYTIISADRVGAAGHVIAVEPEPTNCSFIAKSLTVNHLTNVSIHQKALSDRNGELNLFLCKSNYADHRIYNATEGSTSFGRKTIKIPTCRLDDLLGPDLMGKVDIIKMDIQGAEAIALKGMSSTLSSNKKVKVVMEFWPWGLKQAGSDPLKLLQDLRAFGFSIFEFDAKTPKLHEIKNDSELAGRTLERQHANLFLTKA